MTDRLDQIVQLRTDSGGPGFRGRLRDALAKAQRQVRRKFSDSEIRDELETNRSRVGAFVFDEWATQVEQASMDPDRRDELVALGRIDPPPELVSEWDEENEALIVSLTEQHLQGLAEVVVAAAATATSVNVIKRAARKRYGIVRRRARTIADDQSEKLMGRLTQATHLRAGVEVYGWESMGDDDVRELHELLDGTTHRWSDPPPDPEGYPGEPVNCRCRAVPVFDAG